MGIKLYPPSIEGTLPAFYQRDDQYLTIPFSMNKTVGQNDITGFELKVKDIQNNELVASYTSSTWNINESKVYFRIDDYEIYSIGMFYKVQLAYKGIDDQVGYYSTVGVIKYTNQPTVTIDNLNASADKNYDLRTYRGIYRSEDITEKVYSYNFTLYNMATNQVVETSGELLHNHENNDSVSETYDVYSLINGLNDDETYRLVYTVTTINGLIVSSPGYIIVSQASAPLDADITFEAVMNEENGYIQLKLQPKHINSTLTGQFVISRASSQDNFETWQEIDRFAMQRQSPQDYVKKDFTVEHGYQYRYSLQQFNASQLYSQRLFSNDIIAKFEHSFLFDGKRQLKIKYNPKVSSFKETLLESKTNTLGGQYPFFFRNANVHYKEFPISGLISYLADEEELFLTDAELFLKEAKEIETLTRPYTLKTGITANNKEYFEAIDDNMLAYQLQEMYSTRDSANSQDNRIVNKQGRTTNLTDYNMLAERIFKMKVLEFLNDGKPKLFRSPGEGNYLVRLMSNSLAPNDQMSRMLHTFSSQATEIDNCNYQTINKYLHLTDIDDDLLKQYGVVETIQLENNKSDYSIQYPGVNYIACYNMPLNSTITITDISNNTTIEEIGPNPYIRTFNTNNNTTATIHTNGYDPDGIIHYGYQQKVLHKFDTYKYLKPNILEITIVTGATNAEWNINQEIRDYLEIESSKFNIGKYYSLQFSRKNDFSIENWDSNTHKFWINGIEYKIINQSIQVEDIVGIPDIKLGYDVVLNIKMQDIEIVYDFERENQFNDLIAARENYIIDLNMTGIKDITDQNYIDYIDEKNKANADIQLQLSNKGV